MVVGAGVVDAMFDTFRAEPDRPQWERLLAALDAGKRAGGQPDGEQSAGLYVVDREPFATVGLRVDLSPEPVRELRRLADRYFPLIPYYGLRPLTRMCRARGLAASALRLSGFRSSLTPFTHAGCAHPAEHGDDFTPARPRARLLVRAGGRARRPAGDRHGRSWPGNAGSGRGSAVSWGTGPIPPASMHQRAPLGRAVCSPGERRTDAARRRSR